jgi:hypothetical protein
MTALWSLFVPRKRRFSVRTACEVRGHTMCPHFSRLNAEWASACPKAGEHVCLAPARQLDAAEFAR